MKSILFVDDDESYLDVLMCLVEPTGVKASYATNGGNALEILRENRVDVMITDYNMPGMNGCQLAARVKEAFPGIVVLMTTGELTHDLQQAAQDAGILAIFEKPFEAEQILNICSAMTI